MGLLDCWGELTEYRFHNRILSCPAVTDDTSGTGCTVFFGSSGSMDASFDEPSGVNTYNSTAYLVHL